MKAVPPLCPSNRMVVFLSEPCSDLHDITAKRSFIMLEINVLWDTVIPVNDDMVDMLLEMAAHERATGMTGCAEEPSIDFGLEANRRNYPYSYRQQRTVDYGHSVQPRSYTYGTGRPTEPKEDPMILDEWDFQ